LLGNITISPTLACLASGPASATLPLRQAFVKALVGTTIPFLTISSPFSLSSTYSTNKISSKIKSKSKSSRPKSPLSF